jgi:hypothetical protein
VGEGGTGALNVTNGGVVNNDFHRDAKGLVVGGGATGTLTVDGAGSDFEFCPQQGTCR